MHVIGEPIGCAAPINNVQVEAEPAERIAKSGVGIFGVGTLSISKSHKLILDVQEFTKDCVSTFDMEDEPAMVF